MLSFFWLISEKLDLVYGMQFCNGADGEGFNAALTVDIARLQALYRDQRGHLNKKVRFRAFVAPATSFLIDRTSSSVILQYSQKQVGDLGSLFHVHTTSCLKKR